jgi:hypothetical protein
LLFVGKNFFYPNLRGGSPEKNFSTEKIPPSSPRQLFWEKYEKIRLNWENMAQW